MEKKFYKAALKQGQKEKRRLVSQGRYPYLPVLEEMVSEEESYVKLQKVAGKGTEERWTGEERSIFRANFYYFRQMYEGMGGKWLACAIGDALLSYLNIFGYDSFRQKSASEIKSEIGKIWQELQEALQFKIVHI